MTRGSGRTAWGTLAVFVTAAIGVLEFAKPMQAVSVAPFAALAEGSGLGAGPSLDAFGASREVRVRFTLPNQTVEFPLEVDGDPSALSYEWIAGTDSTGVDAA